MMVDNGITLPLIEVLFCHWNRHVPIENDWVNEMITNDPDFIAKSVVFDISRSGGEIVIPIANSSSDYSIQSFASQMVKRESHFRMNQFHIYDGFGPQQCRLGRIKDVG